MKNYDRDSTVYQDKSEIEAGENYPAHLQTALESTDVLIIHLSPSWLASSWCRWEFNVFTVNGSNDNALSRIIPLLVVPTAELNRDSADPIARALANLQSIDISELRHASQSSTAFRRFVAKLAQRIKALSGGKT